MDFKPQTPDSTGVVWCDRGWFPFYYGFCPDEKSWHKLMKKLGCTGEPYPTSDGRTTVFDKPGKLMIVVTVNAQHDTDHDSIMGVLVHEATHVKQHLCNHINETIMSIECEAYTMQAIFMCLMDAYAKTRYQEKKD